jgi:hypothetical protein
VGERLRLPLVVPVAVLVVAGGCALLALLVASALEPAAVAVAAALAVAGRAPSGR